MVSVPVQIALTFIKIWINIYQILTYPFYYFFKDKRYYQHHTYAMPTREGDPSSPWRNVKSMSTLSTSPVPGCTTLVDVWNRSVRLWPQRDIFGTRETLSSELETQPNGKKFVKCTRGEYFWETYEEIGTRVDNIAASFVNLGLKPGVDRILLFAETRAEWMITVQAAFQANLVVTTLYATLGEEAIIHGINESETTLIVTSDELISKLSDALQKCPLVKYVIFMDDKIFKDRSSNLTEKIKSSFHNKLPNNIQLLSLTEFDEEGKLIRDNKSDIITQIKSNQPNKDSLAFIMYTSGSTGVPKGVEITHGNLMAAISGFYAALPDLVFEEELYIAYLPLAHVMELVCELLMVSLGIKLGYSSPQTLTNDASKIKKNTKGDSNKLKPTIMVCVPTILDRITKIIQDKVAQQHELYSELFKWQCAFKKKRLNRGYPSPFLDKFVFQRLRNILGGRLRYMISGGAPLSEEAHNFINICFCPILQGYGLTETCGGGSVMDINDLRTGVAGTPITCLQIKLRAWPEGGYHPTDKPNPRGEILISGGNVTNGYFKQPEKTQEAFFTDEQGVRWFCSGDIGMFKEDGTLCIIDRKKDLVKLQGGEYVSLGKVELAISQHPLADNVCVYAESSENFTICFISIKKKQLLQMAKKLDIAEEDADKLCQNKDIIANVTKEIQELCRIKKIERFEIPQKIYLDNYIWTSENNMITDAMKLKRREIQKYYQTVIDKFYNRQ